jgi:hypothetical protein
MEVSLLGVSLRCAKLCDATAASARPSAIAGARLLMWNIVISFVKQLDSGYVGRSHVPASFISALTKKRVHRWSGFRHKVGLVCLTAGLGVA